MMNTYLRKLLANILTLDYHGLTGSIKEAEEIIVDLEIRIDCLSESESDEDEDEERIAHISDMIQFFEVYLDYANEILQFIEFTGEPLSETMRKYEIKYLCDKHIKEMSAR